MEWKGPLHGGATGLCALRGYSASAQFTAAAALMLPYPLEPLGLLANCAVLVRHCNTCSRVAFGRTLHTTAAMPAAVAVAALLPPM